VASSLPTPRWQARRVDEPAGAVTQQLRARIGDPISGQLVLDKQVTLPLDPRVIKLIDGERMIIDYFKLFTLKWDQQLEVGQTVSLKAVSADLFAEAGEETFTPPFEITTTVKNCCLFK
jgi:hypothetical protein